MVAHQEVLRLPFRTRPMFLFIGPRSTLSVLTFFLFGAACFGGLEIGPPQSTSANPPQKEGPAFPLEAGKPVEKTLAGGEIGSYGIKVGAEQFVHIVVEQLGISVVLTVFEPNGRQIASMGSLSGSWGKQQVSIIADSSGIYTLRIVPQNKNAWSGRYRVSLNIPRPPVDADHRRIAAERVFTEGWQSYQDKTSDSLHRAIQKFEEALSSWRNLGDAYEEFVAIFSLGATYRAQKEIQLAVDYYNQALVLARAKSDPEDEARTLFALGDTSYSVGKYDEAIEYYNQTLPLVRAAGNRSEEAVSFLALGNSYESRSEFDKAVDYYNRSLRIYGEIGKRDRLANVLERLGDTYTELGAFDKALGFLVRALDVSRETRNRHAEAVILEDLGRIFANIGKTDRAIEYYEQALAIHREVKNTYGEGLTVMQLGYVYRSLRQYDKAIEFLEQSLAIQKFEAKSKVGEAYALNDLGSTWATLKDYRKAIAYYGQSLSILIETQNRREQAREFANLMFAWDSEKVPELAILFGKQAVNIFQDIRIRVLTFDEMTRFFFNESVDGTYRRLANLLITQGRLLEAQQVLDMLKNEQYFEFIRRDGKDPSAVTASVNLTNAEKTLSRKYEENAARVTAIGTEWTALRAKLSRTPEEEKHLSELSDQLRLANQAWEEFLDSLFAELGKSREAQTTVESIQENSSGMQRVLRELEAGTVALYTLVGEDKLRLIVVTPTVMIAREYPIKAEELRKKVFAFRGLLVDPKSQPIPEAQELYKIIVGPVAQDLAGAKAETLMWSLDDVLRYIPVGALHDGQEYLVEKYKNEVFTPASAASLTERPNVTAWRGLGMGVSKSYGDFSALPSVPEELHRIIRDKNVTETIGVVPGQTLLDEAFTEVAMKKALEQNYPLVHIASHFAFAPGNETNSFLLLGGKDAQGEHLSLGEIRKDPGFSFIDTELLTLSACNTAVNGAAGDGREVDGLGILAQQKGAHAVIASLWGVYDPSTGILMQEFYKLWTTHPDMTKGEALREAQVELLRGQFATNGSSRNPYTHPFYWAPFVLIGNWR